MRRFFDSSLVGAAALLSLLAVVQLGDAQLVSGNQNLPNPGGNNPNMGNPNLFTGTGNNPLYGVNMAPWGPDVGDKQILANMQSSGQTIDLHTYFPFYGGLYNYSTISVHGYVAFATVLDQGPTINVGPLNTDWPRQQDPAMIAPYLCKQQVAQGNPGIRSGVYYRVVMRQSMFGQGSNNNLNYGNSGQSSFFGQQIPPACQGAGTGGYVQCNAQSDVFLDEMMRWLQEGVAGASAFRADAALVVTWYNTASAIVGRTDMTPDKLSVYQLIWLTDRQNTLSYTIINYDKLGFDAADFGANSRNGRCQALFNGGNHTGIVPIDPTEQFKNSPKILARRSGVPHVVRGRYMFRVDDLVRPAGCSNKTGGTYPLMIYPNIINMLGEMTVEVNGLCMDAATTYVLMIEQRPTGPCTQINPAIARCTLPKVFDWGTKTVYFQPQSGGANDEKAYVGYIYFVPPTIDPMRLDIGNVYEWFKNPLTTRIMPVSWYPRNFTNPDLERDQSRRVGDDSIYNVQLGLYVIGYKEFKDETIKKYRPEHKPLALLGTIANSIDYRYRWQAQQWMVNLDQVERWLISDWDRANDLFTYRLGYLKLAPMRPNDPGSDSNLISGLVSAPISLHWLWTNQNPGYSASSTLTTEETERRTAFVAEKATEMCHDWYNEDGAQWNFIHDTETNASCPCVENQAKMDLGRFMPHPRCSQTFRDVTCTATIGARNCYMSAQNIYGSYSGANSYSGDSSSRFATHYGQVCCYDDHGTLMQTSYQPVIKTTDETPYSPGFPMRAYEFGTEPYQGQFQVPGLSAFYHDQMPYFFCCKYAKFRCQLFYWRRPSSGCQAYQPPAIGYVMGAGTFNTIDNQKFIFNEPGVYTLLYIPETAHNPMVRIQVRLERYPNRKVDFSLLGLRLQQEDLVQPTNATVITAIALESSESDRVHVLARKDTRRMRYRTSIIVGNLVRYFDNMKLQRYRGVLIYVNNVQRGQSEVYVVLEKAQIGLRIRESYGIDIDRLSNYQESMGMLDISLSVPPQYGVRPDGTLPRETDYRTRFDLPKVQGLLRPFPDAGASSYPNQPLNINNDVNNDGIRQQLISQYRVAGSGEQGSAQSNYGGASNNDIPRDNMFLTSRDEDKKFDAFPDAALKASPIYQTAPVYQTGYNRFSPKTGQAILQFLENCRNYETSDIMNLQPQQSDLYSQVGLACPDNSGEILQMCGDNAPCLYDATLLQSKVLGTEAQDNWNAFNAERFEAVKQYNSCGAINIEYPEYLLKTPAMSSGYLQNDVARFECFQSHWIHGTHEYKCSIVEAGNDPYNYRFEWNKGWQPWCRSRAMDNMITWMLAITITLFVLIVIMLIFLCFWCAKQRRIELVRGRRDSVSSRPTYYKSRAYIPNGQKSTEKNEVPVFGNTPRAQLYTNGNGAKGFSSAGDMDDSHHGPGPTRTNSSPPLHTDRPEWRDYPNRPPSGYSTPPRYNTPPYQNGNSALQGLKTSV